MKVLIADDDKTTLLLLERFLEQLDYEVIKVENGKQAWEILQTDDAPSIAVLDWMMPCLDGIEICKKIRQQQKDSYTYILLLTSKTDKDDLIEGMDAGADDYLSKPFDKNELKVRLRAGGRIIELTKELFEARNSLLVQATHDGLTGIWNRDMIMESLESELDRAVREKKELSLFMLDLDHFKAVNDKYGHLAGDQVLREVVSRIKGSLRGYDAIGRYGGEEFLIMFPGSSKENAIKQAERILNMIASKPVDTTEGVIKVTASIGLSTLEKGQELTPEQLVKEADDALYKAKESGRNCAKAKA